MRDRNFTVFDKIYTFVYKKLNDQYTDVFLCGGASTKIYTSTRDEIRKSLNEISSIRVLYPEDLFIEILNVDKRADLLNLEGVLADNCDLICIVAESAGSLVELGAFVNNENTKDKVVALIDISKAKDKSFIMLGPVRHLQLKSDNQVVFYDDDLVKTSNQIRSVVRKYRSERLKNGLKTEKDIDTIVGIYNLLPIILYFYTGYDVVKLREDIKKLSDYKGFDASLFENTYNASIKLLYKEKLIMKIREEKVSVYRLTDKGYSFSVKILNNLNIRDRTSLYDSIRFDIMDMRYYCKKSRSS